ncbi:hypothetical protein [Alicyclobacillus sp. SO9]|uniref:hypothetical protein n=1 Tax=Alicyclobacillus sp. SO9 TaxID=2665646 RepID=UPI0018E8DE9F|nr:hypothetical protein [Alicyclobacillus sp. SO9]QQE79220.1 hypothetical protein GI364_01520 [Alicyclobacillus sp. SO9]
MTKRNLWVFAGVISLSTVVLVGCSSKTNAAAGNGTTNKQGNANGTTTNQKNAKTQQTQNTTKSNSPTPYTVYKNKRFGFTVRIPTTYKKSPPPQDGDGASWTSSNAVKITAYGQYNVQNDTVASAFSKLVTKNHPSYKIEGKDWLVVSGINQSNQIYYTKMYIGKSKEYVLKILYPKSQKSQDASLVTAVANSFQPGPIQPADSYSTYTNQAYHFSLKYPSKWTQGPTPANGSGRLFYVSTNHSSFSNMASSLGLPAHDAVIQVVGTHNPTNVTYASVKNRPSGQGIVSYKVSKVSNGYEIQETQKKGNGLWYTIQLFNKNYFNTLTVIIPSNSGYYKGIAQSVIQSYTLTP